MKKLDLFKTIFFLFSAFLAFHPGPAKADTRAQFQALNGEKRERFVLDSVMNGKAPSWWHNFLSVEHSQVLKDGKLHTVTFMVSPDYLGLEDENGSGFFYAPVNFFTVKKLAGLLNAYPLTAKMVDLIYQKTSIKIWAKTFPAGPSMTTSEVFLAHSDAMFAQLEARKLIHPEGTELVTGHKKDYVITKRLFLEKKKEAIYGWHYQNGNRIQPLSLFHGADWVDYSQGVRLVHPEVLIDGQILSYFQALSDPLLSELLSSEGVIHVPAGFWK